MKLLHFLFWLYDFMTNRREVAEQIPADDLIAGGQGREPKSLLADALGLAGWMVIIAVVFMFLATCTGCALNRGIGELR